MEIINLDDNVDLNDIIEDLNPSPIDLNMSGGAEPASVFNNFKVGDKTLYFAEVWEVKSVDGNNVVITKGGEEKTVNKGELIEYEDPQTSEFFDNPETREPSFEPVSPPPETAPKTPEPSLDPVSAPKQFSAVAPPTGLYDAPSDAPNLTSLLDQATQPQPSGIDKLPEEPETFTDIVTGVESTPDGNFVQVEKYIENITGLEYERYLGELDDFFTSSKKKKNKTNFDFVINNDGYFEKRCKPGVDKKKDELVIIPPKYVKIHDALKIINIDLENTEFELREMRDKILLKDKGITEGKFSSLKKRFYTENDKKQIFLNYKNKINKVDETNKNILRLSLEKAELRTKLRNLFNEISDLNRVPNKDLSLINLKIKEYLELNKINYLDREIHELKNRETIDYVIMEPPKITKPETPKKKRLIKKTKEATEPTEGEPATEAKPKKKKIIRKKKTKGGSESDIDIEELLDIVEDDINIIKENDDINLQELIKTNETAETANADETSATTADAAATETVTDEAAAADAAEIDESDEIDLDELLSGGGDKKSMSLDTDDIETLDLESLDLSSVDLSEQTKSVNIQLPQDDDGVEELNLGDDLEELGNYEEEMEGGNNNYSFENTYQTEVPEDKIDNEIPLKLEDTEPIKVNVVKLGHN